MPAAESIAPLRQDLLWRVVEDIARALTRAVPEDDPGLSRGDAGVALFLAHHHALTGDDATGDAAVTRIERMLRAVARRAVGPGFFDGLIGPAWVIEHLQGAFLDEDPTRNDDTDVLLERWVASRPVRTELLDGLTGVGVYALERTARGRGWALLDAVLARLDVLADEDDDGISWLTPHDQLFGDLDQFAPGGLRLLGIAHGQASLLPLLAGAIATPAGARARKLLDGATRWMLAQRCRVVHRSLPRWVGDGARAADPSRSRLSWCWGDLGVACALADAAYALGDPTVLDAAREIAIACASLDGDDVTDASLCHGSIGCALMFDKLATATGARALALASRRWLDIALAEHIVPGRGVAGVAAYQPLLAAQRGATEPWVAYDGVLYGAAGVGLGLLALLRPGMPRWDRAFAGAFR